MEKLGNNSMIEIAKEYLGKNVTVYMKSPSCGVYKGLLTKVGENSITLIKDSSHRELQLDIINVDRIFK